MFTPLTHNGAECCPVWLHQTRRGHLYDTPAAYSGWVTLVKVYPCIADPCTVHR